MLQPLATGLAAAINYDLSQISSIRVVERQRLRYLLDELKLVEEGLTAEDASPRLGRIVGAEHLVSGSVGAVGDDEIAVSSGISDTHEGVYSPALQTQETFGRLMQLQKRITFAIIDSLGITLTPEERDAIAKVPTEDFQAFLVFSRGLDALDRGDYSEAASLFERASVADPGFSQAIAMQQEAQLLDLGAGSVEDFAASGLEALTGVEGIVPGAEDIFELRESLLDPRATEEPSAAESGTATVGGRIR